MFLGTEIGDVEADVGENYCDEVDFFDVEAFADHLSSDEDVGFVFVECFIDLWEVVAGFYGVAIGP